jgi:polyhydroxyalkanoate synthesis regulator protein
MKSTLGQPPMDMMKMPSTMKAFEEQTKRNVEMFQNAMRMFTPFPGGMGGAAASEAKKERPGKDKDLQELKEQIAAMQKKLDSIGE